MMKLVVHAGTNVVVGCHMVGPDAAEIMQGMAVAVKLGATKEQLDAVVGIHPSSAEEFVTMRSVTRRIRGGTASRNDAAFSLRRQEKQGGGGQVSRRRWRCGK